MYVCIYTLTCSVLQQMEQLPCICLVKLLMRKWSAKKDNAPAWTDYWNQWQRSSNSVPFTAFQIPSRQLTVQNLRSHPLQARVGLTLTKLKKKKGNGLDNTSSAKLNTNGLFITGNEFSKPQTWLNAPKEQPSTRMLFLTDHTQF